MKVLLLGITGNVGSRLAPALISHGHSVVAYVRQGSRSKINPALAAQLSAVVEGEGTDSEAIKTVVLDHDCSAAVNCAGVASLSPWSKPSQLTAIFAAVIKGVAAARQYRGKSSPPIRVWMLSGQGMLDYPPNPKKLISDVFPLFPEHRGNFELIKKVDPDDVQWSLLCATQMMAKHEPALATAPDDYRGNMVAGPDTLVAFQNSWLSNIPLIGGFLNVAAQAGDYMAPLEYCVDFVAEDLEKGLESEYVGRRVCLKLKSKAS
jgi:nucleoside-diphosphate-sugar epimerase